MPAPARPLIDDHIRAWKTQGGTPTQGEDAVVDVQLATRDIDAGSIAMLD